MSVLLNLVDYSWNTEDNKFVWDETQEGQRFTEENNNQFKINFELPYGESSKIKFGASYRDQSKMRDDIWYGYDYSSLNNLSMNSTFEANVDGYEPGNDYQLGNFMDARFLGRLDFGGVLTPIILMAIYTKSLLAETILQMKPFLLDIL